MGHHWILDLGQAGEGREVGRTGASGRISVERTLVWGFTLASLLPSNLPSSPP